jgi:hypothetical protein
VALLTSEIDRIRYECGYNVLDAGAEPYIGVTAVFDQVIATYLRAGAATTSATAVTAATTPTPVAITLTSATGFAAGARVWVDVDARQEVATVQSITGAAITVQLSNAHSGTYPLTVDGGEGIVREILAHLRSLDTQQDKVGQVAGLKRVDEIEWHPGGSSSESRVGSLKSMRMYWRDQLCGALGVTNMWRIRQGAGQALAVF